MHTQMCDWLRIRKIKFMKDVMYPSRLDTCAVLPSGMLADSRQSSINLKNFPTTSRGHDDPLYGHLLWKQRELK